MPDAPAPEPEAPAPEPDAPLAAPAPPPKPTVPSARNLIVLENFELPAIRDRASLVKTLWGDQTRRLRKPPAHPPLARAAANPPSLAATNKPLCVITQKPARFCDPATGMPFASLRAYRDIRRLLHGEIRWSYLLGAYVGEAAGAAAKGVPEGF